MKVGPSQLKPSVLRAVEGASMILRACLSGLLAAVVPAFLEAQALASVRAICDPGTDEPTYWVLDVDAAGHGTGWGPGPHARFHVWYAEGWGARVAKALAEARFFELADNYGQTCTVCPTLSLRVKQGERTHQVKIGHLRKAETTPQELDARQRFLRVWDQLKRTCAVP